MSGDKLIRIAARQVLLTLLLVLSAQVGATGSRPQPVITVIIDDMGNQGPWGEMALRLPGAVTYSFLPHTPFARRLALKANAEGKEVMLHLPMESHDENRLGPGGLTLHMTESAFKRTLNDDLKAVPYAVGLNNHMGSLLTRHPGAMAWLMRAIRRHGNLFFIDSRTTLETVAQQVANENGVPSASRDVFLDNDRDPKAIARQFQQLLKRARHKGYAIGIGHPYPETSQVLAQQLTRLKTAGIRLIPASQMIAYQRSRTLWQASSSHSPRVAKNSKP